MPGGDVELGKPKICEEVVLSLVPDPCPPTFSTFGTPNSLGLFDLLGLSASNDSLLAPCSVVSLYRIMGNWNLCEDCCSCEWHCWKGKKTSCYRSIFKIITNQLIRNVLYFLLQGCHLMTEFANTVKSQEAREYLVQVVEQHRKLMTKFTKEELEKCWSHQDNSKVIIFSLFRWY